MKIRTKLIAGFSLFLILISISYCSKKYDESLFKEELKQDEKEKVIIDQKKKTVTKITRKNDGSVEKKVIDGVRKSEIIISNDNKLTIKTRNRGTLFEPGLSLFYSKNRLNLGLDIQFLYWRKYGLSMGFGTSRGFVCSAYVSTSYNLFSNTSGFIGLNDELKPVFGFKVAF